MNIALICTEKLPVPPIAGGAIQLYIEGILPYISQRHNITVYSIQYPGLPQYERKNGVKYIRVPAKDDIEYINNLKNTLTKNLDLIHVFNRPAWVNELSSAFPDIRFSLSLHNEMFAPEKITSVNAVECIERVEFINTVSRFIADGVKKLYPQAEGKLNVVHSGADINKYKPNWTNEGIANKNRLKKKYNLEKYNVVLFVGRLSVKKGVDILLNAMKKVMGEHPDTALVVVGSKWFGGNKTDDYTRSLENLSATLPGPVVFTGFLPPSEVISHYNLGDIFVCPSQWNEPLARVHYEAMAAGLPIITTNRGGNAEVVSGYENGVVLEDYSNPDALAEYISDFITKPSKIIDMGKNGRMLAESIYNWKRVAEDILKAFNTIEGKLKNSGSSKKYKNMQSETPQPLETVSNIKNIENPKPKVEKVKQKNRVTLFGKKDHIKTNPIQQNKVNNKIEPDIKQKDQPKTKTVKEINLQQKSEITSKKEEQNSNKTTSELLDKSKLTESYRNYLEKWHRRKY